MHEPLTGLLALKAMRAEVTSAQPHSPVVPDRRPARAAASSRARTSLARGLHALAARVEPTERGNVACSAGAR
ncbi:MAG: hypothetical protein ACOYX5_14640 [Actinomycetota bacterium]